MSRSGSRDPHDAHDLGYVAVVARAADFDLAAELGKPSFTPAARDAPKLVELVVAGEDPGAARAAQALAKLGTTGRAAIEAALAGGAALVPAHAASSAAITP